MARLSKVALLAALAGSCLSACSSHQPSHDHATLGGARSALLIEEDEEDHGINDVDPTNIPPTVRSGALDQSVTSGNEPTIAVNPSNTQNVVVAAGMSMQISTNAGSTFTANANASTLIPAPFGSCGDSSVAFDSQGRLFWTFLGCQPGNNGADIFVTQVNPTTGAFIGATVNITLALGLSALTSFHDKEWLAADRFTGSPFQDRLYVVWSDFTTGTAVRVTTSTDQGANWTAPVQLSAGGEGFVWPAHVAVAANGDVYAGYHSQPSFAADGNPDGTTGRIFIARSSDGAATFPQKNTPFTAGNGDLTYNVQTGTRLIPRSASCSRSSYRIRPTQRTSTS